MPLLDAKNSLFFCQPRAESTVSEVASNLQSVLSELRELLPASLESRNELDHVIAYILLCQAVATPDAPVDYIQQSADKLEKTLKERQECAARIKQTKLEIEYIESHLANHSL